MRLTEVVSSKTAVFAYGRLNPPTTGHQKLVDKIKNTATQIKTTINLVKLLASPKSPAGKTTTLEIKAASVEYAIQSNNLNIFEFSSILSENNTPNDLDK